MAALVALAGSVAALVLIRSRDFVSQTEAQPEAQGAPAAEPVQA